MAIETQSLEMQVEAQARGERAVGAGNARTEQPLFPACQAENSDTDYERPENESLGDYASAARQLALCFLLLAEQDAGVFERQNRYEARLWRQALQIICALSPIKHRYGRWVGRRDVNNAMCESLVARPNALFLSVHNH
jgi:hypothetical protein